MLAIAATSITALSVDNQKWAYVVKSDDGGTITFYYDTQMANRGGNVWGIDKRKVGGPIWTCDSVVTQAVFDPSFAEYRPTSTSDWFVELSALESISGLQYLNTSDVTDMSGMFAYCKSLTSLDLSGFNTENVRNMDSMFGLCESLTSLDVSGFNTENVKNMNSMFYLCYSLTSLDVSGFNTENVMYMSSMFSSCNSLTSLDVSCFNTANVKSMYMMFSSCHSLTSLDVSGFNTENVKNMYGMFAYCSNLEAIYCNDPWVCDNSRYMFSGCVKLAGEAAYDGADTDVSMATPDNGFFTKHFYTITLSAGANGSVEAVYADTGQGVVFTNGRAEVKTGSKIVIVAKPDNGYAFDKWSDNVVDAEREFTIKVDLELGALFKGNVDSAVRSAAAECGSKAFYTLDGLRLPAARKGLNIVRTEDGRMIKVVK